MDPNESNLDVYQMQADLAAQAQGYTPGPPTPAYGDYQADLTSARASYGDVPAMMFGGMYATGAGAIRGTGNMFSAVGSQIMPARYTPPARVATGYYGQYQQDTGFLRGLAGVVGLRHPPVGTQAFRYGYYNAADIGERVGGGFVAGATGAAGIAASLPTAAMGGMIGGMLGAPLGPVGALAGSAIGSLGGAIAGFSGMDSFAEMIAQRRQIDSFLESSSFRYVGAGSPMADPRLGGGMSTAARRNVTDFMRKLDVKDPNLNLEDISGILQGATGMGMFTGSRDIEDFKAKFKEIVEGVKTVSKTLGTSLQEGLQVMRDFRGINIMPGQMGTTMFQADVAGKITGRTAQEVVGLGLQGAELFRGTGIEMKLGYQSNVMNLVGIRAARDSQMLSQEAIVQAGGEEALAQRMTASGLGFMQSAAGRGFGAAFFNPAAGPAGFDRAGFMNAFGAGGAISYTGLAIRGASNLSSPDRLIKYEAYQDKFMSEAAKAFGGDTSLMVGAAATAEARMLVQTGATDDPKAAFRLTLMKQYNMSASESDALYARIQNAPEEHRKRMEATQNTITQRRVDEAMSTVGFGYLYRRTEDYMKGLVEPIVGLGMDTIQKTREGIVNFHEKYVQGVQRYDFGQVNYRGAGVTARSLVENLSPEARALMPATGAVSLDEELSRTSKVGAIVTSAGLAVAGTAAAGLVLPGAGWIYSGAAAIAGVTTAAVGIGLTSWTPSLGRQVAKNIDELSRADHSLRKLVYTKDYKDVDPNTEYVLEDDAVGPILDNVTGLLPGGTMGFQGSPLKGRQARVMKKSEAQTYQNALTAMPSVEESAKIVADKGKVGVARGQMSLETIARSSWYRELGTGNPGDMIDRVTKARFSTSLNKLSTTQQATFRTEAEELATLGMPELRDAIDANERTKADSRDRNNALVVQEGINALETVKDVSGKIGAEVDKLMPTTWPWGGFDKKWVTPKVMGYMGQALAAEKSSRAARDKGTKEGDAEAKKYTEQANQYRRLAQVEIYKDPEAQKFKRGGEVGQVIHKLTMPEGEGGTAETEAFITTGMQAAGKIEAAKVELGFGNLREMILADDKLGDKGAVLKLFDRVAASMDLEKAKFTDEEKKVLGTSPVGQALLATDKVNKVLADANKTHFESDEKKTEYIKSNLKSLKLDDRTSDAILKDYTDNGLARAKQHTTALLATNFAADQGAQVKLGEGSREAKGTEQGTGQEQGAVQMNINLTVLSILNTLANNLKPHSKAPGG